MLWSIPKEGTKLEGEREMGGRRAGEEQKASRRRAEGEQEMSRRGTGGVLLFCVMSSNLSFEPQVKED